VQQIQSRQKILKHLINKENIRRKKIKKSIRAMKKNQQNHLFFLKLLQMMTKMLNNFWHREDHASSMNESENSISSQRKRQRKTPKH